MDCKLRKESYRNRFNNKNRMYERHLNSFKGNATKYNN